MTKAFWDSSALVPLFVQQGSTSRARRLYEAHGAVIWWGTPVEIAGAIARLERMGQLDVDSAAESRRLVAETAPSWDEVQPSFDVRERAIGLIAIHRLRAADSLQLSAAIEWCNGSPNGDVFLTADQKLRQAARQCGFDARTV